MGEADGEGDADDRNDQGKEETKPESGTDDSAYFARRSFGLCLGHEADDGAAHAQIEQVEVGDGGSGEDPDAIGLRTKTANHEGCEKEGNEKADAGRGPVHQDIEGESAGTGHRFEDKDMSMVTVGFGGPESVERLQQGGKPRFMMKLCRAFPDEVRLAGEGCRVYHFCGTWLQPSCMNEGLE